ncbi:MAG: site-specific DNA-methyltransferase [Methanosarcinales archaeon]|nr:site-specific DNA-methyltransferase [Methanosarcinales archaeon]
MIEPYFESNLVQLFNNDCIDVLNLLSEKSVDMIFANPPYFLSNGGISCRAGKMVSVNKADWDKSQGFEKDFEFTQNWIKACRRVLKDNGTIWISGTMHNIYQVGFSLQKLNFKILNEISWFKPNAPPNLSCKYFVHSHETILWARKHQRIPHDFNYNLMREWHDKVAPQGKQMKSVWHIPLTPMSEKNYGKHPTQKPIELLKRIITASTNEKAIILDPFNGSGTTGVVATMLNRQFIGIDKEESFLKLTMKRINSLKKNGE